MVKKVMLILALGGGIALAACNTVRGAGQDVESVANSVDNAT